MLSTRKQALHATLEEWVHAHTDALLARALQQVSDRSIAEDLVQDTFMAACVSFEQYRQESKPRTWLFGILEHKVADHFRKKLRNPVVLESSLQPERAGRLMEQYFAADGAWLPGKAPVHGDYYDLHLLDDPQFSQALQQCMDKLPTGWYAAIHLKYLEEKKGKEICQDLNLTTTNYWQILHRAKVQLRQCLDHHWFKR